MIISFRVTDEEGSRMKAYAEHKGISVSQLLRSAVQERLHNEYQSDPGGMGVVHEETIYTAGKHRKKRPAGK